MQFNGLFEICKRLKITSRLKTKRHFKTVGDGALDVPLTNNYKTLMAKEETNALDREEQAPPLRTQSEIAKKFVAVKKTQTARQIKI